jgi:hypothetical protein
MVRAVDRRSKKFGAKDTGGSRRQANLNFGQSRLTRQLSAVLRDQLLDQLNEIRFSPSTRLTAANLENEGADLGARKSSKVRAIKPLSRTNLCARQLKRWPKLLAELHVPR